MGGVASTIGNTVGEAVKEIEVKPKDNVVEEQKQTKEKTQEIKEQQDEMLAFKRKLEKLKIMRENGILTEEEMEQEKKKLLENI